VCESLEITVSGDDLVFGDPLHRDLFPSPVELHASHEIGNAPSPVFLGRIKSGPIVIVLCRQSGAPGDLAFFPIDGTDELDGYRVRWNGQHEEMQHPRKIECSRAAVAVEPLPNN